MPINFERLADSIYHAEGGAVTRHPYGVMRRRLFEHPRAACLRICHERYSSWNGRGSFLVWLAARYCPQSSDPIGHSRWIVNVRSIYRRYTGVTL